MEWFGFVEWTATFVENLVVLCTIAAVAGRRYQKTRHYPLMFLSTVCLSAVTAFMNSVSVFSFVTPVVAMCFAILLSYLFSGGSLLLRSAASVMAFVVIVAADYIIFALFGLLMGWSENTFPILMAPGVPRLVFLVVDKSGNILWYFFTRRLLMKICMMKRKFQWLIFCISFAAFIAIQYLFGAFLGSATESLYAIFIFSWICSLFLVAAAIIAFILLAKSEQEKQTHMLLESTNQLLAENYQRLHIYQQNRAKQLHDFNHHLAALKGLASKEKHGEVSAYIDSLLSVTYQETVLCNSGNDIIDAIINYKAAEAKQLGITFSFTVNFHTPISIDPVDICGALANQIDNAFDACMKISSSDMREVRVAVKQIENFVFFRVENTVDHDPFQNNRFLASTKADMSKQHGLGLKNIRDIADKYNGFLRNEYKDGFFISVVSLCCEPND